MSVNMHYDYADRKNGRQVVSYFHPDAEEVLGDTYGLMIYQESVMRVAQKVAGYSLAEADLLRKAMGKKSREVIATERKKFIDAAAATAKPVAVIANLASAADPAEAATLRAAGVPVLEGTATGLAAFGHLLRDEPAPAGSRPVDSHPVPPLVRRRPCRRSPPSPS
jgi:hypothetical protein